LQIDLFVIQGFWREQRTRHWGVSHRNL